MGRPRDVGTESWATVTEVAEALDWSVSNVYRRIKANTIPHEQHVESERASYRIDRAWLRAEMERKAATTPATTGELAKEGEIRAAEIIAAFVDPVEAIHAEVEKLNARPDERERVEWAYRQKTVELQEKVYALLSRVEEAERERTERGQMERRSFWRRLFGGD